MLPDKFFEQIESRIIRSGRDIRYKPDGYGIILASLDYHKSKSENNEHLTASEVVHAVSELALMKYGPMALEVLEAWGIFSHRDVGNIVYNLIDIDILQGDERDSLDDFVHCDKLFSVHAPSSTYRIDKKNIKIFKDA